MSASVGCLALYLRDVRYSDAVGAPLMIGVISNQRTAEKVRLYARQLEPAGAFFIHNRHLAAPADPET